MRGLRPALAALAGLVILGSGPVVATAADPPDLGFAIPRGFIDHSEEPGGSVAAESFRAVAPTAAEIRTAIFWDQVQPGCAAIRAGRFDWRRADEDMRLFVEEGVSRMVTLNGAPRCASARGESGLEPRDRYVGEFARFAREVVERYGPGGEFFDENPDLAGGCCPVTRIEVWNEPNLGKKWSRPRGRAFARFFVRVSKRIHSASNATPEIDVITGAVTGLSGGPWRSNGRAFLRELLAAPGIRRHADGIGVHTYAESPSRVIANLAAARRIIRRAGARTPIDITEHGWSTCPEPGHPSSNGKCVTRSEQARMMDRLLGALRSPANARLGVRTFLWFMAQDSATSASVRDCPASPKFFYGLYDHSGEAKPSWEVWSRHTDGEMPERIPAARRATGCPGSGGPAD